MRHRLMRVVLLYLVLVHQRAWPIHILVLSTSGSKIQVVHQRATVAHSVTMMVSVVIMNHVTVVIVSMETVMIVTTVKPKLVYDAHEMSLNLPVMKPPVVQLVWVGIVLRIVA